MGMVEEKRRKKKTTRVDIQLSIEEIITDLVNSNHPLSSTSLAELTNLSSPELKLLEQAWAAIEPKRRQQIIKRLVEIANDNVEFNFDDIFKNCLKDQDAEVRNEAIEGLWENEEPSMIDPLTNLLMADNSEKVQTTAASALGKFAMLAEFKKLSPDHTSKISHILLSAITDRNKPIEVRRRALEAAAPLSHPDIRTAISEAYQSNDDRLRVSSIYAMGKSCDLSWLPVLLKELTSNDAEIRYEAAGACGELEGEEAVPHLTPLINDPDREVQLAVIKALSKIGGTMAKQCLKQCADNPNESISQTAEQALQELSEQEDLFSF